MEICAIWAICGSFHLQDPYPLRGFNSDLAQYSNTPSLRAAGFEDEDDDEDSLPDVACGLLGEAATG